MKENPFPGMNPWLEAHRGDVHTSMTIYARDQLESQLPTGLRARVEEYVAVEIGNGPGDESARFAPDVRVVETRGSREQPGASTSSTAVAEPLIVPRYAEPETLHYIQIVDKGSGDRIVTTIEFLSLANKATDGSLSPRCDSRRR